MTPQEMIAESVLASKPLFTRYLAGFTEDTRLAQAPGLPNHPVWCLGHCALTMTRVAEVLDGAPITEAHFVGGDGTQGDAQRYDTESICFGSTPIAEGSIYPSLERGTEIYEAAVDRLANAVRSASMEQLAQEVPWHGGPIGMHRLIPRVCFHNGTHAGQLTDLRRALQMQPVIS